MAGVTPVTENDWPALGELGLTPSAHAGFTLIRNKRTRRTNNTTPSVLPHKFCQTQDRMPSKPVLCVRFCSDWQVCDDIESKRPRSFENFVVTFRIRLQTVMHHQPSRHSAPLGKFEGRPDSL